MNIQLQLSTAAQVSLCTNCPLPTCDEGSDRCPLVIEQRRRWRLRKNPTRSERRGGARAGSGRPVISYTTRRNKVKATVPDQALMSEAADTITELRAKVASLEKSLKETQEELEREQGFSQMAADTAREQFEEDRAEYEEKIEFLEADRLRLANLIHPDTPGCDVAAGRCHWCESATSKRTARADLLERERNDYKRQAVEALEKIEQRNAAVRALILAVERVLTDKLTAMPIEVDEQLREAVGKVKEWGK